VDIFAAALFTGMKEKQVYSNIFGRSSMAAYRTVSCSLLTRARRGILLIGGRKGAKNWYGKVIGIADEIYAIYLKELKRDGLI
jgi:hypothetical protein